VYKLDGGEWAAAPLSQENLFWGSHIFHEAASQQPKIKITILGYLLFFHPAR